MQIDDLKVNQWIIITGVKPEPEKETENYGNIMMMIPTMVHSAPRYEAHGIPYQIKAISLPFLAGYGANDDSYLQICHITKFTYVKADISYVNFIKKAIREWQSKQEKAQGHSHLTSGPKAASLADLQELLSSLHNRGQR